MVWKMVLLTKDEEYLRRFTACVREYYSMRVQLCSFTDANAALLAAHQMRADILLTDIPAYAECQIVRLCSEVPKQESGIPEINRYCSAHEIIDTLEQLVIKRHALLNHGQGSGNTDPRKR